MKEEVNISEFAGKTFTEIRGMESGSEVVYFDTGSETYKMYHSSDCCESVYLDDVCGVKKDHLCRWPFLLAVCQRKLKMLALTFAGCSDFLPEASPL